MATSRVFRFRKPSLEWIAAGPVIAIAALATTGCGWLRPEHELPTCGYQTDEVLYFPATEFTLPQEAAELRAKRDGEIGEEGSDNGGTSR